MNNSTYKKKAMKKLGFSLIIVMVYLLGNNITFPGVDTHFFTDLVRQSPGLSLALGVTGVSLNQLSLFSIGLGPWMSAMILWRVLTVMRLFNLESLTSKQSYQIKFIISLIFGCVQALGILSQLTLEGGRQTHSVWQIVVFLITGFVIIIWLGGMNMQYGFGGQVLLIIINMIQGLPKSIMNLHFMSSFNRLSLVIVVGAGVLLLFLLFFIFRFYQGERRLALTHVLLDNHYAAQSYLPIPTNPAGGMPFMYAFSIQLFPQYLLLFVGDRELRNQLIQSFQIDHVLGGLLLLGTMALFTYGFSYVNIDYKTISEDLKKSGDYFVNVYPGKNTERYLFRKVTEMATLSAVFNCFIMGVPLVMAFFWKQAANGIYLIPTFIVVMILMRDFYNELSQTYHRDDYQPFVKGGE